MVILSQMNRVVPISMLLKYLYLGYLGTQQRDSDDALKYQLYKKQQDCCSNVSCRV